MQVCLPLVVSLKLQRPTCSKTNMTLPECGFEKIWKLSRPLFFSQYIANIFFTFLTFKMFYTIVKMCTCVK